MEKSKKVINLLHTLCLRGRVNEARFCRQWLNFVANSVPFHGHVVLKWGLCDLRIKFIQQLFINGDKCL